MLSLDRRTGERFYGLWPLAACLSLRWRSIHPFIYPFILLAASDYFIARRRHFGATSVPHRSHFGLHTIIVNISCTARSLVLITMEVQRRRITRRVTTIASTNANLAQFRDVLLPAGQCPPHKQQKTANRASDLLD